jgi:EAL domain-containing protein (putative c-di-GMP-specific phosphodiesterase class I)
LRAAPYDRKVKFVADLTRPVGAVHRRAGVGTGYSSLAYLVRLPVDILKLDRTFIQGEAPLSGRERAFTQAILDLGHSLQLQTIAECVETPDQADMLRDMRCALAQGHLFGRPQEAAAIDELARTSNGRATSANAS